MLLSELGGSEGREKPEGVAHSSEENVPGGGPGRAWPGGENVQNLTVECGLRD